MFAPADQRQVLRSCIRHVRSDIWKVFEKPESAESNCGDLSLPKEIARAKQRHNQLRQRTAQNHWGITKYAKEWVPTLMNHQIRVVEKKKSRAVCRGVHQKQEIKAQPANSRISRNWLPFSELFFQEIHSDKRSKQNRSTLIESVGTCRNSSTTKPNPLLLYRRQRLVSRAHQRRRLVQHHGHWNIR